ncbi:hypothetical protein GWN42_13525 [candidate division KSB1 bacterium]|nr:hypothetical protein [candidate division KSB1 bacterium]
MKYTPEEYQRNGTIELLRNPKFGLLFDPGLGKTATVLHLIKALSLARENVRALVIAPRLVCLDVWPEEIEKWDQFRSLSYLQLREQTAIDIDLDENIWLINPEIQRISKLFGAVVEQISYRHGLKFRNFEYWVNTGSHQRKTFDALIRNDPEIWPFDVLVVDESSKFKNWSSKRFKILRKFIPYFRRRIIMTGTFAPNGLLDIFSQQYIIDNGKTFGKQITTFRNEFFVIDNPKYYTYKIKGSAETEEIQKRVAPWVMRLDAEEHLDLPEIIHNEIRFSLPKKIQSNYDDVEKDLFTELETGQDLIVPSSSAKYLLCRQMASGSYYDPNRPDKRYKLSIPFHKAKTERLAELIDELHGKPLIVAYVYESDMLQIQKDLKKKFPVIGGKTSETVARSHLKKWNQKKIPVLLVQTATVAHGLNMQKGGNDICFYTLTDHLEDYEQLIRRIYRKGTTGQVRIHYLIAKNTIDVVALRRIRKKETTERSLLKALESYRSRKNGEF